MNRQNIKPGAGKVLPFEQNGEFFFRRGLSKLDNNNLLDAMAYYRQALARDPKNTEIRTAIAETLTEMYRFEESNRLLFATFPHESGRPSECYFGMGMNFLGLKEYEHARDSFEQYANLDPEGEYIYDAYDMLDALDESFEEYGEDDKLAQSEQLGRELMEHGDYAGGARILEELLAEDPDDMDARNNLALCRYCQRDFRSAMEQVRYILDQDPQNIQAHCNMAVFLQGAKDVAAAQEEGDLIAAAQSDDPGDLNRMALSLMELKRFADAHAALKRLFRILPYDAGVTHRLAQCAYQLGEYRQACNYYERLIKIDPYDSVARYYRSVCRAALAGAPKRNTVTVAYQVPVEETIIRIHKLNHYLGMDANARRILWQQDAGETELLIRWGIQLGERSVKRAMLHLTAAFMDEKAEALLRDFLLQRTQPGDLKREVFGLLKHMGAQEPYLGYMDGDLIESRVNLIKLGGEELPDEYNDVLDVCMEGMQGRAQLCMVEAANVWGDYIGSLSGFPKLSRAQVFACAAVLEYAACRKCETRVTKSELCRKYEVSLVRFNNAMARIMNAQPHTEKKEDAPAKGPEGETD